MPRAHPRTGARPPSLSPLLSCTHPYEGCKPSNEVPPGTARNPSVVHPQHPTGTLRDVDVMRDDDDRPSALGGERQQELDDLRAGLRVEVSVGSSASSTCGSLASARAMATRCCSPPETMLGTWSARGASPTDSRRPMTASRRFPAGPPLRARAISTLCAAVSAGIIELLEDESERVQPERGEHRVADPGDVAALEEDLARAGTIERAQKQQKDLEAGTHPAWLDHAGRRCRPPLKMPCSCGLGVVSRSASSTTMPAGLAAFRDL